MFLHMILDADEKERAQKELERSLRRDLVHRGVQNIGFPGGNTDQTIYAAGDRGLWVAFAGPTEDWKVPRYWNAFGVYRADLRAQTITVEINIPIKSNTAQVSGFFAKNTDTGDVFLMHSGKIGGGRTGIGKHSFLAWSMATLWDALDHKGLSRSGIVIGQLGSPDLTTRIWRFVEQVQSFKDHAIAGDLETTDFRRRLHEFDRYQREFSGRKRGWRARSSAYITYHGDIVQKLYEYRTARKKPAEQVLNSPLVDLLVKSDGALTEVYEVKTGTGRQVLYTAIGQLMTHSAAAHRGSVRKVLVVPKEEHIPADLSKALSTLDIEVLRFWLEGRTKTKVVRLGEAP